MTSCSKCITGYEVISSLCSAVQNDTKTTEKEDEVKSDMKTVGSIGTGVIIGVASLSSLTSLRPDHALWSLVNLIQLVRTLTLLQTELPKTL